MLVIDDCYNANPMSMRAALDDLAASAAGRTVAVLGDMLELGEEGPEMHRQIGRYASERGVDLLVSVGPLRAGDRGVVPGRIAQRAGLPRRGALAPGAARARGHRAREGLARGRRWRASSPRSARGGQSLWAGSAAEWAGFSSGAPPPC